MLEQLMGSKTRVKLLHIFFQYPDRTFFVRELARMINSQLNAVRREMANLEEIGLIVQVPLDQAISSAEQVGTVRSKYFRLHDACPLFFELKTLLMKSKEMLEMELVDVLKRRAGEVKLLMLTGCFTGADDIETDLLLVGSLKPLVVGRIINDFEKKLGKDIRYTMMEEKEYWDRKELGDKFLYSIFESKNIPVIDELPIR